MGLKVLYESRIYNLTKKKNGVCHRGLDLFLFSQNPQDYVSAVLKAVPESIVILCLLFIHKAAVLVMWE